MKHLFVNTELALMLKDKGFNEPCLQFFTLIDNEFYLSDNGGKNGIGMDITAPFYNFDGFPLYDTKILTAPLYQQVIDWLREKYNIDIYLIPQDNGYMPYVSSPAKYHTHCLPIILDVPFYESWDTAIKEALKLIPA